MGLPVTKGSNKLESTLLAIKYNKLDFHNICAGGGALCLVLFIFYNKKTPLKDFFIIIPKIALITILLHLILVVDVG